MNPINLLASVVSGVIVLWHSLFGALFGSSSGASWALSIVFLTITMRLLLFPLFVKQIRSQRAMQSLAPKIKELQKRHKGDRETLNKETMALYKENNANPIAGCLPLVLQLPIFYALFHVLNKIKPNSDGSFSAVSRLSASQVNDAAHATIFGAPIAAAFSSSQQLIDSLGGNLTVTKVLAVIMIVLMGLSTFITQKQMMSRTPTTDPQQQRVQKIMLYVLPFSFAIFGFNFPLGVLLYWLTTNFWSMGQQFFILKRMPPALATAGAAPAATPATGRRAGRGESAAASPAPEVVTGPVAPSVTALGGTDGSAAAPAPGSSTTRAATGRDAGTRKNRKKRPGGRR